MITKAWEELKSNQNQSSFGCFIWFPSRQPCSVRDLGRRGNHSCRRLGGLPPTLALKNGPAAISVFSQQGYVTVNTNIDYNFTKLYIEWGIRHTALHNEISKKGLRGPSELNCFLWLLECYNLAKHPAIVKVSNVAFFSSPVFLVSEMMGG